MQNFSISPQEMLASPWRHRELLLTLIRREVLGRYRGSVMGIAWSFLHPLFMLGVYTFVFSVVFQARWGTSGGSHGEFALVLFSGLMALNLFSECLNKAPTLISNNINFVKKIVFPLDIMPWVVAGAALFHLAISFAVWLAFYIMILGTPPATVLLVPLILLPLVLLALGVSWVFMSMGAYLRDMSQITAMLTSVLMFLSPVFYPVSALPESYRPLIYLNPLTTVIEQLRMVMLEGALPDMAAYCGFLGFSLVAAWLGFAFFQKIRRGFADVL